MRVIQQATELGILARANAVLGERPDRLPRAVLAALPYGRSALGGVAASRARYPHALALVSASERLTYDELWQSSAGLARGLETIGVSDRSKLGILCRNNALFVQAMLAGVMIGADVVFLNTGMAAPQLADVISEEGLSAVVHDDDFASAVAYTPVPGVGPARAAHLITSVGPSATMPPPERASRFVVLTSGTTGRPKGAVRSSEGATSGVAGLLGRIPLRARDTVVLPAPFFHAWGLGMLLIGLSLSCTVVTRPEFDAETTLIDVAAHRADVIVAVPAMLQRLCDLEPAIVRDSDFRTLRVIASGGSALPRRVVATVLQRFGPVLYNIYGSTEVSTASIAAPGDLLSEPGTAGRPVAGVRVAVLGDDGQPVPAGVTGRVFVGSASNFLGYTGGGRNAEVDGLAATGDLGHFDKRGRLYVDGREDDMIVSGGENVYPVEVEDLLGGHVDVSDVAVIGVPDERFGQSLKAFVVLKPGAAEDAEALKGHVREQLARYKVPREVQFLEELPRSATGKVLRRNLS